MSDLADKITDDLFTNALGVKAQRLVMEAGKKLPGCGWGYGPIRDKIAAVIDAAIQAEREACIKDLCYHCRETDSPVRAFQNELPGYIFWHTTKIGSKKFTCKATKIRERVVKRK